MAAADQKRPMADPDGACATAEMPVAERFVSLNGEGLHSGRLAAFIRFTGCNLTCTYCDTSWANDVGCPHDDYSVDDLVFWVARSGASCVTLTGGEPALQPGLPALVEALAHEGSWGGQSRIIELETNGAVDLGELHRLRVRVEHDAPTRTRVCFTLDCKLATSGMAEEMLPENYALLRSGDAVKFVVGSRDDLEEASRIIDAYGLTERCTVFFSPVWSEMDPADIAEFIRENQLPDVRLQLQLHKAIWPGVDRGV